MLNAIVVWTIQKKEVELDATQLTKSSAHLMAGVDSVVVQNHVNVFCVCVVLSQFRKQLDEEERVLLVRSGPHQRAISCVQRSGNIGFLVLARCNHLALVAPVHPIQPNLRVEMDIDFIFVDNHLIRRKLRNQPPNTRKSSALLPFRQRAPNNGFRISPPNP